MAINLNGRRNSQIAPLHVSLNINPAQMTGMSQDQSIDPNIQQQDPQPLPPLQAQYSSPNMLPSALPHAAYPKMAPSMSGAPSMPLLVQGPYGTPSSRGYYPPDHPFSAAVRDMPVFNLEAANLGRGNSNMARMPPQDWNMSQGQSLDPTVQHYPSPAPLRATQVLWPNFAPRHPSMPPGQMYSRLPPDSDARKAPRKSAASTTEALRSDGGADPAQRRASKLEHRQRRDTPTQQAGNSRTPLAQGDALHGYHNSIKSLQALQAGQFTSRRPSQSSLRTQPASPITPSRARLSAAARGRPIILDDDDSDDDDDDGEYVDDSAIIPSIEVDEPSSPAPPETTARRSQRRPTVINKNPPRPRSKYADCLPYGLSGMKAALGDDNWHEYCTLIEKKILGHITEEQFTAQSKAIFIMARVVDEGTTAKVERRIAADVVMPMIEWERKRAK